MLGFHRPVAQPASALFVTALDVIDVAHLDQIAQLSAGPLPVWIGLLNDAAVVAITGDTAVNREQGRLMVAGHLRDVARVVVLGPDSGWTLPDHCLPYLDSRLADRPGLPASLGSLPVLTPRNHSYSAQLRALDARADRAASVA